MVKKSGVFSSRFWDMTRYLNRLKTDQCVQRRGSVCVCVCTGVCGARCTAAGLASPLPSFLSPTTSMNSGWTAPHCRGFMIYVSWSVTPNQRWLAEWRRAVSNTRQTIQIQSWTLELITNIRWERAGQSVSLRLFISVSLSLYHSFCLPGSLRLNLAMIFLLHRWREKKRRGLQKPVCLCCCTDVSLQTIASHDGCFYEFQHWESGHRLTHSSPAERRVFPRGSAGRWGKGSWQSPALTKPLD